MDSVVYMNNDLKNTGHVWRILHSYESEVFGYIIFGAIPFGFRTDPFTNYIFLMLLRRLPGPIIKKKINFIVKDILPVGKIVKCGAVAAWHV